jgi:anti-anti-sigma regulatory factor
MARLRTFRLDNGSSVVAVRGELDGAGCADVVEETELRALDGAVVVDLRDVAFADPAVLEALVDELVRLDVTLVAERRLLGRSELRVRSTLAAALL